MGELECLVDFIYKGEVSIGQDELESFLQTAHDLQVKGIEKKAVKIEDIHEGKEMDDGLNLDNDHGDYNPPEAMKVDVKIDILGLENNLHHEIRNIEGDKDANISSQKFYIDGSFNLIKEMDMTRSPAKDKYSKGRKRELFKCQHCDYTANRPNRLSEDPLRR